MILEEFKKVVENRFEYCKKLLYGEKNVEYSRDGDKLHNFKVAARYKGETPEKALWGMWVKHIVSIEDIINDLEKGMVPSYQTLNDKIGDGINYYLLLEGLLVERLSNKTSTAIGMPEHFRPVGCGEYLHFWELQNRYPGSFCQCGKFKWDSIREEKMSDE